MKVAAPIRILGIGSPLGDDEVGWLVAKVLQQNLDLNNLSVSMHDRPGANLIRLMHGAEIVILIDAIITEATPGTLYRLEGNAIHQAFQNQTSTHGFGLAEALKLAQALGEAPANVVLWGMEIVSADPAMGMSDTVREAIPALVNAIEDEVTVILERNEN
ncbi:hydrogenase maturation protease [Sulfurirhabdus autotrophica]|uniref:Hydrogenase maturation protease n=1 Tax=Sulfurirhabdus autotrophica TaxID=1706046 RepID=A0A4V2W327_9PROT|nr:hydrogenase maturation protease [Sulfurirhabdus autotrophica]TCV90349.1 hydrogenase maturation protease [Sulfurirhabdus autotrophica]